MRTADELARRHLTTVATRRLDLRRAPAGTLNGLDQGNNAGYHYRARRLSCRRAAGGLNAHGQCRAIAADSAQVSPRDGYAARGPYRAWNYTQRRRFTARTHHPQLICLTIAELWHGVTTKRLEVDLLALLVHADNPPRLARLRLQDANECRCRYHVGPTAAG